MKVMVFGYGRMGKHHVRVLSERAECECSYFEPYMPALHNFDFDHAVISTPIINHYQVYQYLRTWFNGPILVEKPAVIYREQFNIFEDKNVFVGVIERYNPTIKRFKELLKNEWIQSLQFTRVSEKCHGEPYFELAIHDLDLMVHLLDLDESTNFKQLSLKSMNKVYTAQIKQDEMYSKFIKTSPTCVFSWGESSENCRIVEAICNNKSIKANLLENKITIYDRQISYEYFEPQASLKAEHDAFFNKEPQANVKLSHDLMLRLLGC